LLYWLLYQEIFLKLHDKYPVLSPFRIFRFLTFRTAFASLTALFMALIIGPAIIRQLREFQIGQYIREEGPQAHQKKAGTPTMGGVLITIAIVIPTILWADLSNKFIWLVVFSTMAYGAVGFADDYLKVVHHRNLGLTARSKMALQILVGIGVATVLVYMRFTGEFTTHLIFPFFKNFQPDLVWSHLLTYPHLWPVAFLPFVAFVVLVLVGASNAVNLTDGLDGLAIGPVMTVAFCYWTFTYVAGNLKFSAYLGIPHVVGAGELAIFCASLIAASLGFLWYNAYPASMMMGDVGALGLGGALGIVAVLAKQELVLPIAGGVFVIEAASVILQRYYYKATHRRIFRMAPLHHHFELGGWPETQVVVRFWIISIVCALVALSTLKLR